jgi:hypothetical protein
MNLLLFDMDGVLLQPLGYHRALQETVRLASLQCGFGEVRLQESQIARFEALGISSEWHSSAFCLAWMELQKAAQPKYVKPKGEIELDLESLFNAIAQQPQEADPVQRGLAAIKQLSKEYSVLVKKPVKLINECESIDNSQTLNWFQEFILGSQNFATIYEKKPKFQTESYLKLYDKKLLNKKWAQNILDWNAQPDNGAVIMTSRPSFGPKEYSREPDAHLGAQLIGLEVLPLVGIGEIRWLAEQTKLSVEKLKKPAAPHALAALLAASGWTLAESLDIIVRGLGNLRGRDLGRLDGCRVTVVEDTIGGFIAAQAAAYALGREGARLVIRNVGVAMDKAKVKALKDLGAVVYPDVNKALADILQIY